MSQQDGVIEKYADKAMFEAAPMKDLEPQAYLLWMTPDPMGAVAAASRMYEGIPTYSLDEVTDEERIRYWEEIQKTHLQAPLEFVKFHFFIEGVDRAFTHQHVRQRTAVFAQESLRFAVKHNLASESLKPPSMVGATQSVKDVWEQTLKNIEEAYNFLVANGIPAEDARGLLPHCVATRLHWCTDLKNLIYHSGNRLCTQAQFIWRKAFNEILRSIAEYQSVRMVYVDRYREPSGRTYSGPLSQGRYITNTAMFRPACYQQGHCPFKAGFDRGCTIRERVDAFASYGIQSYAWGGDDRGEVMAQDGTPLPAIDPREWLLDPKAAWVR